MKHRIMPQSQLFRVCSKEVRIYPLQKSSFKPYERMPDLLDDIKNEYGIAYDIIQVPFEFQKGSNKMLCLTCNVLDSEKSRLEVYND